MVLPFYLVHKAADVRAVLAASISEEEEQKSTVDPTGQDEGYSAVLYDNTNGLPTSEANAIAETSDGFIWIGSYSGLIRYDGNTFERIDSTEGIASVVSLFVDSSERLWIGTNDSGAAVMEHGEYHIYNKSNGLKSSTIRSIVEGSDGNIYIATTRGVAMVDPDLNLHTVDEPLINEEYIRVLRLGIDGIIYGVTTDGAVFTMQDGRLTGYFDSTKMGIANIRTILPDSSKPGYVYIGTAQSALYYGRLQNGLTDCVIIDLTPLEYTNSIDQVNDAIWISADNGIGVVKNGEVTHLENIPIDSSAEGMIADYQGNLWFASSKQGVMKIVPNQFTDIYERYDLPTTVVNTTCLYNDMLFIGTKNNGLTVVDQNGVVENLPLKSAVSASGESIDETDLIQMLQDCRIRSIIRDSQNRLWISTFGENALLRYDNGTVTRFTTQDGLPSDRVRTVFECQDGSFLAACTGGLTLLQDDVVTEVYGESSGINNPEVLTAIETKNKELLIGTDGDGIYMIKDSKVTHIGMEAGLPSDVVMRLKYDLSRDIIWIVASNAIAYMDADYHITTIREFPYSNNFDLYENTRGEMWILSSNGIYVTTAEELLANEEISTVYYGRDNGLSCITTSNSYSELTPDGDLYIAGSTGVAKVNIEQPFESVDDIIMSVPYIEADGALIYPDASGTITIPSDVKKLTIYSYVYNYTLMNPQVTYYLDGFDDTQTTVKRSELVPTDYTNLRGGTYHFVMQLKDSQGRGSKMFSIPIVKEKALYELLWFRILCGVAATALIAWMVMLYIRHKT
ncbi:MAG: histidine kinase, partial [Lachnospiraceae bacterium]|nr:histidine kinase [Lachnospiraceae bacterium]